MHYQMQQFTNTLVLFRARLLLAEGKNEQALSELETMQPENEQQQREKDYFLSWCYILDRRWEDAGRLLAPFAGDEDDAGNQQERIERERRLRLLLRLGALALNLGHYEDAERHLRSCLRALRYRPFQSPAYHQLRMQASYALGVSYHRRGLYTAAIQQYEEALQLSSYSTRDEQRANIYASLCDSCRQAGQLEQAWQAGEKALALYQHDDDHDAQERIYRLLGQIAFQQGNAQQAEQCFTRALSIATGTNNLPVAMLDCEVLIDLYTAQHNFSEARTYAQQARELSSKAAEASLRGQAALLSAKVARAEARQAEGEREKVLLAEAITHLETAHNHFSATDAHDQIIETLTLWAQTCESLGQTRQSLRLWRAVYEAQSKARGLE
jgi:tetratricopeptide (TPR) repeat protein